MPKEERERIVSPPAHAMYVWINEPDTKFDKEGKYKVTSVFDTSDSQHNEFLTTLWNKGVELQGKGSRVPIKKQEDGSVHVTFQSKFQPKIFDASGKRVHPDDVNISSGSVLSVSSVIAPYETPQAGKGIALWIQGVQIIELQEFEGAGFEDHGFKAQAGFESEEPPDPDSPMAQAGFESEEPTDPDNPMAEQKGPNLPDDGSYVPEDTSTENEIPF